MLNQVDASGCCDKMKSAQSEYYYRANKKGTGGILMEYVTHYESPLGRILLAADSAGLTGLWFEGQKYYAQSLRPEHVERELPVFKEVKNWLDIYFSGGQPDYMPPVHMTGTDFQIKIWEILRQIPYGEVVTYGEIAYKIAEQMGRSHMSAQAVGSAVGHNKISIIIPCHRVVGTNGSLTGYAGGINRKIELLSLEKVDMSALFIPKRGTAL